MSRNLSQISRVYGICFRAPRDCVCACVNCDKRHAYGEICFILRLCARCTKPPCLCALCLARARVGRVMWRVYDVWCFRMVCWLERITITHRDTLARLRRFHVKGLSTHSDIPYMVYVYIFIYRTNATRTRVGHTLCATNNTHMSHLYMEYSKV